MLAQQPLGVAEVLLRQAGGWRDGGAGRRGVRHPAQQAVGGQQLALRGLRGTYEDVFLPLFGLHQAGNAACALAAVEAFAGVSDSAQADGAAPDGPGAALDANLVREAFAEGHAPPAGR